MTTPSKHYVMYSARKFKRKIKRSVVNI